LKVTQIHQVVEYTPAACFQKFGETISDARRAGDTDSLRGSLGCAQPEIIAILEVPTIHKHVHEVIVKLQHPELGVMRRTYFRLGPLPDRTSSSHVTLSLPAKRPY
jgi:hypothetical protein